MRRPIGWMLVLLPAGYVVYSIVDAVVGVLTGHLSRDEFTTALIIIGMVTVMALVPIGIGALLLLGPRRESTGTTDVTSTTGAARAGRPRERLGWALMVPGLIVVAVVVVNLLGRDAGVTVLGAVGATGLVLLGAGIWIVVTQRRDPGHPATPDTDPTATPTDDRELQDH